MLSMVGPESTSLELRRLWDSIQGRLSNSLSKRPYTMDFRRFTLFGGLTDKDGMDRRPFRQVSSSCTRLGNSESFSMLHDLQYQEQTNLLSFNIGKDDEAREGFLQARG